MAKAYLVCCILDSALAIIQIQESLNPLDPDGALDYLEPASLFFGAAETFLGQLGGLPV